MTRNSEGSPWGLGEADLRWLADLSRSRTASFREVLRAKIILDAASGKSLRSIARDRGLSRNTVAKTLHKILSMGPEAGLDDLFHRPGEGKVSAVERAFILGLARTPPGKAEGARTTGRWTILELTAYLREKGPALGYPSFATIGKSTVHRILKEKGVSLRSRREPSPNKRREILLFFREFALIVEDRERGGAVYSLAPLLAVSAPGSTLRRLGYSWVVGGLDESTGEGFVRLERRFGAPEFLSLLEEADSLWAGGALHLSFSPFEPQSAPEVQDFLGRRSGRFVYDQGRHTKEQRALIESLVFAALSFRFALVGAGSWDALSEKVREAGSDLSALLRAL